MRNLKKHRLGAKTVLFLAVWEMWDLFYARKRWFDLFHCSVSIPGWSRGFQINLGEQWATFVDNVQLAENAPSLDVERSHPL